MVTGLCTLDGGVSEHRHHVSNSAKGKQGKQVRYVKVHALPLPQQTHPCYPVPYCCCDVTDVLCAVVVRMMGMYAMGLLTPHCPITPTTDHLIMDSPVPINKARGQAHAMHGCAYGNV